MWIYALWIVGSFVGTIFISAVATSAAVHWVSLRWVLGILAAVSMLSFFVGLWQADSADRHNTQLKFMKECEGLNGTYTYLNNTQECDYLIRVGDQLVPKVMTN